MKDVDDIIKYAIKHKEGFSVSIDLFGELMTLHPQKPNNRFIVAHKSFITIDNFKELIDKGTGYSITYFPSNRDNDDKRAFFKPQLIGGYFDTESNKYLIEIIQTFDNLTEAVTLGKIHKQKYIYDLWQDDYIPLQYNDNTEIIKNGESRLIDLKSDIHTYRDRLGTIQANYFEALNRNADNFVLNTLEERFQSCYADIKRLSRRIVLLSEAIKDLKEEV